MPLATQSPLPFYADADGSPLDAGRIYFGTANGNPETSPVTVYWDAAGTQPAAQPIRTLNGFTVRNGTPTNVFVSGDCSITVRDKAGALVVYAASAADLSNDLNLQAQIDSFALTSSASNGAGKVGYDPDNAYAAGTVGGRLNEELTTIGFSSLQAAVTAAAGKRLRIIGTHTITAAVVVQDNTELVFDPSAVVQTSTIDISHFTAVGKTGIKFTGPGKIKKTGTGTAAYVAGAKFTNCTNCHVEGVTFEGMQWAGVLFDGGSKNSARFNWITAHLGTVQDASDICVFNDASDCIVEANWCFGGCEHGVLVQDPYAGLIPRRNIVNANTIGQHTGYGVALYAPGTSGSGDSNNQITNNNIRDILGSYATNRSSGNGVYVVGAYAGGTLVASNVINNCCSQTLDRALAPAGIGLNGIPTTVTRPLIADNIVNGMTQGDGINISSCPGGAVISGGTINIPSSNNGTGPGGATLVGSGVRIEASSNVTFSPMPDVSCSGTGVACFVYANGVDCTDIVGSGGSVFSTTGSALRTDRTAAFVVANLVLSAIRAKTTSTTQPAVNLSAVNGGSITGIIGSGGTQPALLMSGCTQTRVVGGSYSSSGAINVQTAGACSGSMIDKSVYWGTSAAQMNNAGTGCIVEWRSNAAPASGTWALGDRTEQSSPAVASPKGWRCTVAGSPGTHVSEGAL